MNYVVIGNGGAGVSAIQAIRSVDLDSNITVVSKEQYPSYSPCSLPDLISGGIDKSTIFRFDKNFYKNLNVNFIKNKEVISINPDKNNIKIVDDKIISYDKLLIAAGASPITPKKIDGLNLDGVHIMGTLDSTLGIINHLDYGVKHAVVVGGGFMGIETATMLKKRGIDVSIVEMLPHILSRMLDSDMAEKVEDILIKNGINLILNDSVKSIDGENEVSSVTLFKDKLSCDMVVLAIGVLPNVQIVRDSGIAFNRGIIVDKSMQTNVKNVYAAGDIVEVREQIGDRVGSFAIWPNAIEQGRIAGLNMAGKNVSYDGAEVVNVLDVFDIPVVAMGFVSDEIKGVEILSRDTPDTSKKMIFKNDKIVGLQYIGTIRNSGIFYSLMKKGSDVSDIKDRLLDDNFVIYDRL